jgi:hypothetical protein
MRNIPRKGKPKTKRKTSMKHMNTLIQIPIERPQKDVLAKPARTSVLALIFSALTFACFALSPTAEADNTKLGRDALKANTTGTDDTALGYQTLKNNTTGSANTPLVLKRSSETLLAPAIRPKERLPFTGSLPAAATSPWAPTPALI